MNLRNINSIEELLKIADFEAVCDGFRGLTLKEAIRTIEQGHAIPTEPLQQLPLDLDVIKYVFSSEINSYEGDNLDEYIDKLVKIIVPWYDGSIESIKNGLNLTTLDNAIGYSDESRIVIGYEVNGEIVSFGDYYFYAKDATNAIPKVVIQNEEEYTPEEFLQKSKRINHEL